MRIFYKMQTSCRLMRIISDHGWELLFQQTLGRDKATFLSLKLFETHARTTAYRVAGCMPPAMVKAEELRERQWSVSAGQKLPGDYVHLLYLSKSPRTTPGTVHVRVRTSWRIATASCG